jgi:uncharacterized OB-fold protein/acyl dehydratase
MEVGEPTFADRLRSYDGREVGEPQMASDEVNVAMIRHWCEAIGDRNPAYLDADAAAASIHGGLVAPPAMLQAWVMRPLGAQRVAGDARNAYEELLNLVESEGFTGVVATDCEQSYERYLRPGDRLTMQTVVETVSPEKQTGLGAGHFITTRQDYRDASGALVGQMRFRILKFRPRPASRPPAAARRPRPSLTKDQDFWFDGLRRGVLLIQRCALCGVLRHPPGPVCPSCRSFEWDTVEASGAGSIHSFVVTHYPRVAGFEYPLPIVLVDLVEGVRVVADTIDTEPDELAVGTPVELVVRAVDDELSLPFFRVVR